MDDRCLLLTTEFEHWLRTKIAVAYDALKADPSRGLSLDEVRADLANARRNRNAAAPRENNP